MTRRGSNLLLSGVGLAVLVASLLLGRGRITDALDARAVRGLQPTDCTILESRFTPFDNTSLSTAYPEPMYRVEVRYSYTVDGRDYESDALAPGYAGDAEAAAVHRHARRYAQATR